MFRVYLPPHTLHFQLFSFHPLHLSADSFACTTPPLPPPPPSTPSSKKPSTPVNFANSYRNFAIKGQKVFVKRALLNGLMHGMFAAKPPATAVKLVIFQIHGKHRFTPVTFANTYRNLTIKGLKKHVQIELH
jgi:hypothetical protein